MVVDVVRKFLNLITFNNLQARKISDIILLIPLDLISIFKSSTLNKRTGCEYSNKVQYHELINSNERLELVLPCDCQLKFIRSKNIKHEKIWN